MEKIAVVGAGYVGLVVAGCLAEAGYEVTCVDKIKEKIKALNAGYIPIFEPCLEEVIVSSIQSGRLHFVSDLSVAVRLCDTIFMTVDTPSDPEGKTYLENLFSVAASIGLYMNDYKIIINKSTVPIGTAKIIEQIIRDTLQVRGVTHQFDVVANPEFLSEGDALNGFRHPQRIVFGTRTSRATEIMYAIYRFIDPKESLILVTDPETAEMVKQAANAFLAMKVSFINELANLCEELGSDIRYVARGIGMDSRIGPHFLQPGPGYGGSCFPKDTRALAYQAKEVGKPLLLVEATIKANNKQPRLMAEKIVRELGDFRRKTLCILGLTFKSGTDDIRESPSLAIIHELVARDIRIRAYDPQGMENTRAYLTESTINDKVFLCTNPYEAAKQADAIAVTTEWAYFTSLDLARLRELVSEPFFFDLRNVFCREDVEKAGFQYFGVGI